MSSLERALALAARGLSVIPVHRPDGLRFDGKVPAIRWSEYQRRLPTQDEIARWFGEAPCNVAVVTGAISDIVVIDADSVEAMRWCGRHLPYTPWQTRTARGYHLWYRYPGVRVPNRARITTEVGRLSVDVRGDGGYVIAPGSLHVTGAVYREAGDWTISREQLPQLRPGWLTPAVAQNENRAGARSQFSDAMGTERVLTGARRYLAVIPPPEIGHGSDSATLYAACRLVRGFGLSEAEALELLWEWAGRRPGWTRDWIAQKVANSKKYGTEPMRGLVP